MSEKQSDYDPYGSPGLYEAAARLIQAQRHSILLVEDTAAHAALITRTLDNNLWEVEHVTRASSAIQAFEQDPHRIVLLDLSLPDSSGLQLLSDIFATKHDASVVVVTSTDRVSVSVEAMQKGACDYVVKSDPKETAAHILYAIERAWRGRVRSAENSLIEQAKISEKIKEQRIEAIDGIVKTVCTEVNNPLNGVVALSQLLQQQTPQDGDVQKLATGILQSASQVAHVVKKLKHINEEESEGRQEK